MSNDGNTIELIREAEQRVLWLAARMVDYANHDRPNSEGIKIGGHQASSASVVSIMTALWLQYLRTDDFVSVKPHASPVMHALWYLSGQLDREYLTQLRAFKGLQSYPSRTKDPDRVDFSTGSVGLGAAAPLFAAATRRYVDAHFGERPPSRFISILGDAELDEGNIWEAIADPSTQGLGNVMWIVDFNRQSLDRVVPGVRISQWRGLFEASGWDVHELKYGSRANQAFAQPGGELLRTRIDQISNEQYQSLFGLHGEELRAQFLKDADHEIVEYVHSMPLDELESVIFDLGGHDIGELLRTFEACDAVTDRPSVIFAYTVKGWGLPIAGNPRNHSALLSTDDIAVLRESMGLDLTSEWDRFDDETAVGRLFRDRGQELTRRNGAKSDAPDLVVPPDTDFRPKKQISTQDAFGRILVSLSRDPAVSERIVTVAPDVATSTNLAGFINRTGIFAPTETTTWNADPLIKWDESPQGQHIELGISEMNLFLMLGQLGISDDLSHERLVPIGTVYDPFVCRGLDALIYSVYSGSQFIFAGTPSGVTLSPEGGAHQSTITASIGMELPGLCMIEPAYAGALDWLLCDAVGRVSQGHASRVGESSFYFRLSTRPIDQEPFEAALIRYGEAPLRQSVLAGAYRLIDGRYGEPAATPDAPEVTLAASGAVIPEVLAAAEELATEGIIAHVVDVTSLDRLYRNWQLGVRQAVRSAVPSGRAGVIRSAFPSGIPLVTIHDAASHSMAWIGGALGVPSISLGVDEFGESGTIAELYARHDLSAGSIVNAALTAIDLARY
jgi:pyruvate dehydrogenase E1 component